MNKQLPERLEFLARIEEWAQFERLVYESMLSVFSSKGIELNDVFQDTEYFTCEDKLTPLNRDISNGYKGYFLTVYRTPPGKKLEKFTIVGPCRDNHHSFMYIVQTGQYEKLETNNIDEISRFILDKVLEKEQ